MSVYLYVYLIYVCIIEYCLCIYAFLYAFFSSVYFYYTSNILSIFLLFMSMCVYVCVCAEIKVYYAHIHVLLFYHAFI